MTDIDKSTIAGLKRTASERDPARGDDSRGSSQSEAKHVKLVRHCMASTSETPLQTPNIILTKQPERGIRPAFYQTTYRNEVCSQQRQELEDLMTSRPHAANIPWCDGL